MCLICLIFITCTDIESFCQVTPLLAKKRSRGRNLSLFDEDIVLRAASTRAVFKR